MYFRICDHTSERRVDSIFKVEEYQADRGEERYSYKEMFLYQNGRGVIIKIYWFRLLTMNLMRNVRSQGYLKTYNLC